MKGGATMYLGNLELGRWEGNQVKSTNEMYARTMLIYLENLNCVGMFDIHSQHYENAPKHWRCHTRKRAIKLMMAAGVQRNYARFWVSFCKIANDVERKHHPESKRIVTLQSLLFAEVAKDIRIVYDEEDEYTGSIKVKLYNNSGYDYAVKAGDKISQLVILPIFTPPLEVVDELGDSERGDNGFGSTGK